MLTRVPPIAASEITPPEIYSSGARWLAAAGERCRVPGCPPGKARHRRKPALVYARNPQYSVSTAPKSSRKSPATTISTSSAPRIQPKYAHTLRTRP